MVDWGMIDYRLAWGLQQAMFEALTEVKKDRGSQSTDSDVYIDRQGTVTRLPAGSYTGELMATSKVSNDTAGWLILCEHPHVYTLGRSGKADNLLVGEATLGEKGAALYRVERGGDITYHGPGQIVGYPILDLEQTGLGLREYIVALEQAVIETVAHFGIEAGRVEGKTGVWIKDAEGERKICAIGVKASRGVVMHGFALNVATDLKWFDLINPCGFVGGAVTSMERETGRRIAVDEVKEVVCGRLRENLGIMVNG